ncbi:MAG: Fe-Mn family superoxide dismutase [Candidatus Paceibacterota bacterium]|jgi:Fe-Mn family superoxide dismutase
MIYEAKKFDHLLGLNGFSDTMLKNHVALYEGYVKNVNIFDGLLKSLENGSSECNEIRRRFGWEWNGMRMHELYFSNLIKDFKELNTSGLLFNDLTISFSSYEKWLENFKSVGLTRGIGWVVLVKDKINHTLMNIWIGEHDIGQLVGQEILLVMDVWEHSYITDYGIKRADYIEKFIQSINWVVVEERHKN